MHFVNKCTISTDLRFIVDLFFTLTPFSLNFSFVICSVILQLIFLDLLGVEASGLALLLWNASHSGSLTRIILVDVYGVASANEV